MVEVQEPVVAGVATTGTTAIVSGLIALEMDPGEGLVSDCAT